MAYADGLRTASANFNTAASLIEGIFTSTYPLTWTTYAASATQAASGSLTYATITWDYCKYIQVGKKTTWDFRCTGTLGGVTSNEVRLTLPVAAISTASINGSGWMYDSTNGYRPTILVSTGATYVSIYINANANYTLGSGVFFGGSLTYEAA